MAPASRLAIALKGAILWVLLSCALGFVPFLAMPDHATASIPWIAATFGLIGATSHALVVAIKREPLHLQTSVAAVAGLCCAVVLSLVYWLFGTSAEPTKELTRVIIFTVIPAGALSFAVLSLLRRRSAA